MLKPSLGNITHDQEPFMGFNVRRKDSLHCDFKGDYLDVPSHRLLTRIMQKQGDKQVLFADKVLKFTTSGKIKRRILLITDFAIYIVDLEEYDLLMASTRKTEIVTVLVEATKSDYELEVNFSNRFEYNAAAELVKEVHFEEVDGGIKTRISRKQGLAE